MAASHGRLTGKIAIVTGGSSGIGRAICVKYASEGATVVVADLNEQSRHPKEKDMTTSQEIVKAGGESMYVKCDMTDRQSVDGAVEQTVKKYGRLDILVNNAGILPEAEEPTHHVYDLPDEIWEKTTAINQRGVFYGIRAAAAQMIKQDPHPNGDRGWIVNLSSVFGLVGVPEAFAYVASKHAVMGMTKAAAMDLAEHRVHVNAINPGWIRTSLTADLLTNQEVNDGVTLLHPFRGIGNPEDIVGIAVFLASEDARWVTGQGVVADGGYTAR